MTCSRTDGGVADMPKGRRERLRLKGNSCRGRDFVFEHMSNLARWQLQVASHKGQLFRYGRVDGELLLRQLCFAARLLVTLLFFDTSNMCMWRERGSLLSSDLLSVAVGCEVRCMLYIQSRVHCFKLSHRFRYHAFSSFGLRSS